MSVINQMLKDLKKRQAQMSVEQVIPDFLQQDGVEVLVKNKYKQSALIFVFLLFFLIFSLSYKILSHPKKNNFHYAIQNKELIPTQSQPASSLNAPSSNVMPVTPIILEGLGIETHEDKTTLKLTLNKETLYWISRDEKNHKLKIVLDNANVISDLPAMDYSKGSIKDIVITHYNHNDLSIDLLLTPEADLNGLFLSNEAGKNPVLELNFSPNHLLLNADNQNSQQVIKFSKKPVEQSDINNQYKYALDQYALGNKKKSEDQLRDLVEKYPNYELAREALIKIFLERNKLALANKTLDIGLENNPRSTGLLELKARILMAQGKYNRALQILQTNIPPIEFNPDYHALIAALYQKQGQPMLAEKLYEQLLALRPAQGIWWMGLGIALESEGNTNAAKEAYLHAGNSENLTPELKAFIQTRIDSI